MTERLSQLLHEEATHLQVPAPDAARLLRDGRRLRRRRQLTTGLAVAAVTAVVAGLGGIALWPDDGTTASDPTSTTAAPAVLAVGSEVYVGDTVARVPDTVHSLHYTSAGVLVRSNPNDGASDGSGPESLTLVQNDGTTVDLGTIPEGVGPATDPDEPVYVLAEARGDQFAAVVRDARTGETLDEVPLPELRPSYWDVPPLALDGNTLYAGYRSQAAAVDLATGEHTIVDDMPGGIPQVYEGRTTAASKGSIRVLDVGTGEELLDVPTTGYAWGTLSPDGRFLRVMREPDFANGEVKEPPLQVYDVATGDVRELEGSPGGWGWTADGDLFRPDGDTVTTCDAATGACEDSAAPEPLGKNADLRLGGQTYES